MTTDAIHPDHLKPGDMVGPWRIVESLGSGSFGHVFKVERDGVFFTLKMAVRPAPELPQETPEKTREEREVDGRMRHEAAILMANTSHPGLPHLRAMDRWPHPTKGYLYIATDHVSGEPFHTWRKRTRPTVAQFVDVAIEVVRAVARLHRRGILIRDFKSDHVIVTAPDNKPVVVDLGSAWLPGGSTLTVGLAPGTPHMLPPECVTFLREGSWKQGERFDISEAADLYQVGVFMYEALTECWPFDPRLTTDELLTAIQTVVPRAPHRLNPEVPESLGRIVMRLLEKRPEERYESAEALLQALWEAAKERTKRAWKARLGLPPEGPAPMTQEEVEERRLHKQEAERRAQEAQRLKTEKLSQEQAFEQVSTALMQMEAELDAADKEAARRKARWRRVALVAGPLLLGLALYASWWVWPSPADWIALAASPKGSPLMSRLSNFRPVRVTAAWLCATFAVGCAATPVRPLPEDCPREVVRKMEEMNLIGRGEYSVIIDINQPGDGFQRGTYRPGPIVSRVVKYKWTGPLPDGTLLYGQLWTEGLTKEGPEAVLGRYTEALLPDGRRFPVCIVLGDQTGLTIKDEGSKPGAARLPREWMALAVRRWP
jgi:eukaryotic-like serine/threonine-protein kinase